MANALTSTELTLGGGSAVSILGDDRILIGMGESRVGGYLSTVTSFTANYAQSDEDRSVTPSLYSAPSVGIMGSNLYASGKVAYSGNNYTMTFSLSTPSSGKYIYNYFCRFYTVRSGLQTITIQNMEFEDLMYDPSKGFYVTGSNSVSGFTKTGGPFSPSTITTYQGEQLTPEAGGKQIFSRTLSINYGTITFWVLASSYVRLE